MKIIFCSLENSAQEGFELITSAIQSSLDRTRQIELNMI